MVVDGIWATIGSTNFDNRSFALNEELNLTGLRQRLRAPARRRSLDEDLKHAKKISYQEWDSRGYKEKFFELFSFPIRELL
jgi:cardiolipin synthase